MRGLSVRHNIPKAADDVNKPSFLHFTQLKITEDFGTLRLQGQLNEKAANAAFGHTYLPDTVSVCPSAASVLPSKQQLKGANE